MFEIEGLDQLNKTLSELGKVTGELEVELGSIQFDAESAESIELAIVVMKNMVDNKFENYASNLVAIDMAEQTVWCKSFDVQNMGKKSHLKPYYGSRP